ncbi:transposase [Streptomyces sp. MMS24-I31]|uniref:transposase n=1 Tax=Streptomyces sp. MMS24-I31 TaxID=3351563 RepID=UPI003896E078
MPADFPAWGRVYAFFRRWREHGLISEFHDRLCGRVREREGREAEPTEGVIDAQPVRAAATGPAASRGYDGGKKVPGRKRHIVTDCLGLLLVVAVTAANIGDRDAAAGLLGRACWGGPTGAAAPPAPRHHPRLGRRRLHRRPRRLVPGQTRSDPADRQAHRRHDPGAWCSPDVGWQGARSPC